MSKGDWYRNCNKTRYDSNFEEIDMRVIRDYECRCGQKYEGRHTSAETVLCPQCNQPMTRLISCPNLSIMSAENKRDIKCKDIENGILEKQGVNLSNPGKDRYRTADIEYVK